MLWCELRRPKLRTDNLLNSFLFIKAYLALFLSATLATPAEETVADTIPATCLSLFNSLLLFVFRRASYKLMVMEPKEDQIHALHEEGCSPIESPYQVKDQRKSYSRY